MSSVSWRQILLIAIPIVVAIAFLSVERIPQPLEYHRFADRRGALGIPNFGDVASNLAFLLAGLPGLFLCLRRRPRSPLIAWSVFFAGAALVSVGSAYYHWAPDNRTLVWDRLPMTIGFMGAYVALLSDHAGRRLETTLIVPAALSGLASVAYWGWVDDLRPYFAVQATVILSILAITAAFAHASGERRYLAWALAAYGVAVVFEQFDHAVFAATGGAVGGHTLKHLIAAIAIVSIFLMLRRRARVGRVPSAKRPITN